MRFIAERSRKPGSSFGQSFPDGLDSMVLVDARVRDARDVRIRPMNFDPVHRLRLSKSEVDRIRMLGLVGIPRDDMGDAALVAGREEEDLGPNRRAAGAGFVQANTDPVV